MDMDTIGYFIYMDKMEQQQKQQQEDMLQDIFGEADEDDEDK